MHIEQLTDKNRIEKFFRKNSSLHIYGIGDLDDFFWHKIKWYSIIDRGKIKAIAFLYNSMTLIALSDEREMMSRLLSSISNELPEKFYVHISPGIKNSMSKGFKLTSHGMYTRMILDDKLKVNLIDTSSVVQLIETDFKEMQEFYDRSYPQNWFDPRMLETRTYFGIRVDGRLVSVGGTHTYSKEYRVATLGNVATDMALRNRGYGLKVIAKICQSLHGIELIGLNVKSDNHPAIHCYEKLGFNPVAQYEEIVAERA